MNLIHRVIQRTLGLLLGAIVLWLIVTQIYVRLDHRLPAFVAGFLTYVLAAYVLLPRFIQLGLRAFRRKRIPGYTTANDGLPADPLNIVLIGNEMQLLNAFAAIGWHRADKLSIKSDWKMIETFLRNKPYAEAPFSSLYLYGRRQDYGFQEPINDSPRARHHIRIWKLEDTETEMWVGAGTKDLGIGLEHFTYQISHRTDKHIDQERDYILNALREKALISDERFIEGGELPKGKYISDGKIVVASLITN